MKFSRPLAASAALVSAASLACVAPSAHAATITSKPVTHVVQAVATTVIAKPVNVYEVTKPSTHASLLTTDAKEAAGAASYGFTQNSGVVFVASSAPQAGFSAIHRLFKPANGFVFIPEGGEMNNAISKYGYTDQGIEFYAPVNQTSGLEPVYRVATPDNRFTYTTDKSVRDADVAQSGWKEGFAAFYVQAAPSVTNTAPAQAAAAGYSTLKFNTDFTSLNPIDLTAKGDKSKQWFTDRAFYPDLNTSDLTMVNGNLQIQQQDNDGLNYGISTVSRAGKTGEGFKYGYFTFTMKFDASKATDPYGWPAAWLYSYDALKQGSWTHSNEIDVLEYFNADGKTTGTWSGSVADHVRPSADSTDGTVNTFDQGASQTFPSDANPNGWNTFGLLWSPGKIQWDINGHISKTITYGKNVRPSINGIMQLNLPVGMFSYLDDDPDGLGLILGTSKDNPIQVSKVQVWQAK